eukprot:5689047-Amphidinium_carterae.1
MKAVRGTVDKERKKWKEVENAPARMVYVVKPAVKEDGKKVEASYTCNFLQPYGKTFTANLDVSVLRAVVTVGMTYGWKFAPADIPQAFLYASIEDGQHISPKICVDFGLVPAETLW